MTNVNYKRGTVFDKSPLVYLEDAGYSTVGGGRKRRAIFRCPCGKEFSTLVASVKSGNTTSCGCKRTDSIRDVLTKHGLSNHRIYKCYSNMHSRCSNDNREDFKFYGGRGIRVCGRWSGEFGFINFLEDMGIPPDDLTLDRIDVNGDYEPSNCRWASRKTQSINTRKFKTNTSGRTGVRVQRHLKDGTPVYQARITVQGKDKHLICTTDFELAEFCRQEAELHFYGQIKE